MSQLPSFREQLISQIPALQLLMGLGYRYLTPGEALALGVAAATGPRRRGFQTAMR